jgi:ribulose-phosphate 3-epimerase
MNEIIPAILAESVPDLDLKLAQIPKEVKLVHIDVLEKDIWTNTDINFEAHLMVPKPEEIVGRWTERGAKKIIVHKLNGVIGRFRGRVEIGLGVEIQTPLEEIFPLVPQIDFLHLMSIAEIGRQGHRLDDRIFDRIRMVRKKFPQLAISVDGGINVTNLEMLKASGATRFVVGTGFKDLWKSLTRN